MTRGLVYLAAGFAASVWIATQDLIWALAIVAAAVWLAIADRLK